MTKLTPGARVIYFKSFNFDPAPARVGYIAALWPDDAVIVETADDLALWPRCANVHVPKRRCHPHSDTLWTAWLQWQQNAKQLQEQHSKLVGGYAPQELLTIGMW